MTVQIGPGIAIGSGVSITLSIVELPITVTYSQIVDPGDGTLTGTGFTGTYCDVLLTADQITAINNAAGGSGWNYLLCYATWSAGSVNTTPNDADLVFSVTGTPGVYELYGTLSGWPNPQSGPWNMPVTVVGVGGGG